VAQTLPTARAERVEILENLEVVSVTPEIRAERNLRSESGALITGISLELSRSLGLSEGDVLLQINNLRINSAEDAARALGGLREGMGVRMYFERNGSMYVREFRTRR
jgi:type II secretory pathway component PulC